MSATPIPAKDMAVSIIKIMDEVALNYPAEEREALKAVMLGQLGMAMFNAEYNSPKPWVGLTEEEIAAFDWNHAVVDAECVRAIEAKLKEKNT